MIVTVCKKDRQGNFRKTDNDLNIVSSIKYTIDKELSKIEARL